MTKRVWDVHLAPTAVTLPNTYCELLRVRVYRVADLGWQLLQNMFVQNAILCPFPTC